MIDRNVKRQAPAAGEVAAAAADNLQQAADQGGELADRSPTGCFIE